ncbi:MAG TPA: bifunctional UDP-N-acetylglucosamine diphosphorylase/glucosamine-1-phosphate N-acetyltransferase GlmU [Devosia sp.]|jgi:bifunctional UDP-N-acetylglucosamine pyrophosphorylase/glucosamine-1-phosphate N-acetyltransferase|uniref:bifunctional UDP-N-acetylglucosamine diphosphorylase/glucosamine-1-phosphate N-acetyltransferase GlmU n=1 Tax=Devosia sp. TaxID=1871048 RepID=UPI002DDCA86E|nr:bifunctional UDP-N-acetylglucosamine diphosphorylase/glucosamine-1-phosphate N-acetyltransferase GlmU [Devosia sp.]HEV2513780.1 bifunctional UDP-N-acetylglucosamine diphosphorylase/glucosamine-1-phosphate N-acetyltransferase GlmU [Devosia sp.]
MTELLSIILAAGEGTRMRSAMPKVLHQVGGLSIVGHVVNAAVAAGSNRVAVVTGPGHDAVRQMVNGFAPQVQFFEQAERKGTAHAASMARPLWQDAEGYVAVVYGDHPLLRGVNFDAVLSRLTHGFDAAILGFEPKDPTGYGRFITDGDRLLAIREHKDASDTERQIGLCNACILTFKAEVFRELIDKVRPNNAQKEFYVTDLVQLANEAGYKVGYGVAPEQDVMGVNDRAQLARAEAQFQELRRDDFMRAGVTLKDPSTVYFSYDTEIGRDVTIFPNVVFGPGVKIADGVEIRAFCDIENTSIGAGASIGPFARMRGNVEIGQQVHVGNFVEVKNSVIHEGVKAGHLAYLGDSEVGAKTNIGAGTITCNYDGVNKSKTSIGANAFIGSNSSLVAPVTIGDGAYVASGSVITRDVEPDALAIGRARQENKAGYAPKLKARAEAIKRARTGK